MTTKHRTALALFISFWVYAIIAGVAVLWWNTMIYPLITHFFNVWHDLFWPAAFSTDSLSERINNTAAITMITAIFAIGAVFLAPKLKVFKRVYALTYALLNEVM